MRSILVAALIGLAAALLAPTAANAASCWQRVVDDWRDGHIDRVYPIHCYRDALNHLPEDLRVYGTAENDIQNALTRALARSAIRSRAAERAAARRTASHAKKSAAPSRSTERRRTLAGHDQSARQPTLRLAAAAADDASSTSFPFAPVVAGVLALGAATVVVLLSVRRRAHRRART